MCQERFPEDVTVCPLFPSRRGLQGEAQAGRRQIFLFILFINSFATRTTLGSWAGTRLLRISQGHLPGVGGGGRLVLFQSDVKPGCVPGREGSINTPQTAILDVALHPHVPTPLALVSLLGRLHGLTAPFSIGHGGTGEGVGLALLAPLQTAAH